MRSIGWRPRAMRCALSGHAYRLDMVVCSKKPAVVSSDAQLLIGPDLFPSPDRPSWYVHSRVTAYPT